MARADSNTFACHGACHRHGALMSYEDHHVHPLGYHGPNVAANIVRICPNAHSDTHHLLGLMLRGKPYQLGDYSPAVRILATRGRDAVLAYGDALAAQLKADAA